MSKSTIRGCSSLLQTRLKVAPYSFTIARALRTRDQVESAREGKHQCFSIFYDVNMSPNSKTDSEFSRVSSGEIS